MSPPIPLHAFLCSLQADGIAVHVQDYRRIAQALQGGGTWTRRRLRDTLTALLAKDEARESLLLRRFDSFFSFSAAVAETPAEALDLAALLQDLQALADAPDQPPSAGISYQPPVSEPPKAPTRCCVFLRRWALVLALLASIGLAVFYHWPQPVPPEQPEIPVEPIRLTEPTPVEKPKETKTRAYKNVPYIEKIEYLPLPRPESAWQGYAVAAGGVLLLLLAYLIYLYFNRKIRFPAPPAWDEAKPRRFSLAGVGGKPAPLLDQDTLDEVADAVSYFRSVRPAPTLDMPATVKATLELGGLPDLRFHRSQRVRTVLTLRDQRSAASWNTAAEELAAGLAQRGVPVIFGSFKGTPQRFRLAHGGTQYLEDLEDDRAAYILLIFSDACRLAQSHAWADLKH